MANRIGSLIAVLTADTGKFGANMKRAAKTTQKTGTSFLKAGKKLAKFGAAFSAVALGGVALLVKSTLSVIDSQAKLATQLRISTEALSGYNLAADISGTSMSQVSGSLLKMTKNLGDAQAGLGTAKDGLALLGLTITDFKGLNTEQQFEKIADSLNEIDDPLKRASAGAAIFGRSFQKIDNFIAVGSKGFADFRKETEGFGTALSRIDAAKVEQANDSMRRVKEIFSGVITQLTIRLAPIITFISNQFVDMGKDAGGFGTVLDAVVSFGVKGAAFLLNAWDGLKIVWGLGTIALAEIGIAGNIAINGLTKSFNFMAILGGLAWDALSNGFKTMGAIFDVVIAGNKAVFGALLSFVGEGLITLLSQAETVARRVPGMQAAADQLMNAQGLIAKSTAEFSKSSNDDLASATANVTKFAGASVDAQQQIAALVTGGGPTIKGDEGAIERIATLERLKQSAVTDVIRIAESERSGTTFQNALAESMRLGELEATELARREELKTQLIVTADQERKNQLTEQQSAWAEQFGKSEAAAVSKNQQLWKSGMRGRLKVVGGVLGQLGSLMNSENRKQFEIGKAASIGSTVIATIETSMQAYKALAGIPIVGPALGIAAAASATIAGAAAVQQIKSQSFGGGGSPSFSGGSGGGGGVSAAAAITAPAGDPGDLEGLTQGVDVVINVEDEDAIIDGRRLIDIINQVAADGKTINSIRLGTTNRGTPLQ